VSKQPRVGNPAPPSSKKPNQSRREFEFFYFFREKSKKKGFAAELFLELYGRAEFPGPSAIAGTN
jgi:hypothetical protein